MSKRRTGTIEVDARGRIKPFEPTEEQRQLVQNLAGIGQPHDQIRQVIPWGRPDGKPISNRTLVKCFANELERGRALADMKLRQKVFEMAMAGNTAMAIFLCKVRLGMKETQVVEQVGKDGAPLPAPFQAVVYLPSKQTDEEAAADSLRVREHGPTLTFDPTLDNSAAAEAVRAPVWEAPVDEPRAVGGMKPRDKHIDERFRIG